MMAEFSDVMYQWRRMCKAFTVDEHECEGCPLEHIAEHGCGAIFEADFADAVDWDELRMKVRVSSKYKRR